MKTLLGVLRFLWKIGSIVGDTPSIASYFWIPHASSSFTKDTNILRTNSIRNGRDGRIWTCDHHTPSVVRYQTALRPDLTAYPWNYRGCGLYTFHVQEYTVITCIYCRMVLLQRFNITANPVPKLPKNPYVLNYLSKLNKSSSSERTCIIIWWLWMLSSLESSPLSLSRAPPIV